MATVALAMILWPLTFGCAFGSATGDDEGGSTTTVSGGELGQPEPPDLGRQAPASGLGARVERATDPGENEPSATEGGTDSAHSLLPPVVLDAVAEQAVIDVGRAYLEYDYRVTPEARLAPVEDAMTPELFVELVAPLPPSLFGTLAAEQRMVTVTFVAIEGVEKRPDGAGVYELSFELNESRVGAGESKPEEQNWSQTLVVVVDSNNVVEDLR